MPGVTAISWANSYNPDERNWLLQAGGLELLDIDTIVRLKELDAVARTGFGTMAHYQQISDQLIVPHAGEEPVFFYDPATKQLRSEYAQYPEMLKEGSRVLHQLSEKTDRLASQLRAEQFLPVRERLQPVVRPDTASAFWSSPPQSATTQRRRLVPALDGGYSSFSPLSDPILSDPLPAARADGKSDVCDPTASVKSGPSPMMLSRNVADGTKNKLPVTAWLKSSSRS